MNDREAPSGAGPAHEPEVGETPAQSAATAGQDVGAASSLWSDAWHELRRNPLFIASALLIVLMITMALFPQLFTNASPTAQDLSRSLERPSGEHWFGFDVLGRDYYARTIYGARASILVGVLVVGGTTLIAVIFGTLAGFYGGVVDTAIARLTDVVFAIPLILGALVLLTVLPQRTVPVVSGVIALFAWPTMLRLMRSAVMPVAETDYVMAAKALGANDLRVMRRHILPNALTPVIVYATIFVGVIIVAEAALTFLGVGLQPPAISWGLMISRAQDRLLQAPHLLFFPGLFLSATVFGFILMGDALRDALDPKLR
jgi:oligopeptide transport system permease protein